MGIIDDERYIFNEHTIAATLQTVDTKCYTIRVMFLINAQGPDGSRQIRQCVVCWITGDLKEGTLQCCKIDLQCTIAIRILIQYRCWRWTEHTGAPGRPEYN